MDKRKVKIAIMYDFDKTLCTKNMQEYSFLSNVNMEPDAFWKEATKMAVENKMDSVLAYMYLMLDKAKISHKPIRRNNFVELGKELEFFPGLLEWFDRINGYAEELGANVEHYIISSGLKEIIEGSRIFDRFRNVFACEYYYDENGIACWPKNVVNYTTKTQFLFRINKGALDLSDDRKLNEYTPEDERAIPFRNMIYLGDGLTDVPCMKLVKVNGGQSIAVFSDGERKKVEDLITTERVDFIEPADYSENSSLDILIKNIINKIVAVETLKNKTEEQLKSI